MYRIGVVSDLDPERARVRVTFGADDALVSWWLPLLAAKTHADQVYWMPDLDEHVVCLLDEHAEAGVVLGAIYSQADTPPVASLEQLHIRMKDGTTLSYDREAHRLEISVQGGVIVLAVEAGQLVHIGGEAGQQLVTKTHLEQAFNTHTHPTPAGPSGPPVQPAPMTPGEDVTAKTMGE